ncbi:MAG: PQQ-dependent sugar dehydrogenase [Caulobacteraceae bacterium]
MSRIGFALSATLGLFAAASVAAQDSGSAGPSPAAVAATARSPEPKTCVLSPYWKDTYRPTPAFKNQTRAPAPPPSAPFNVETLASGLVNPWAMAFLPDGKILVTERPGRMRILDKGVLSDPVQGLPPIKPIGGMGLFDVALDPDFARNRTLYFDYFSPAPGEPATPETGRTRLSDWLKLPLSDRENHKIGNQRFASAKLSADGKRLEDVRVLIDGGMDGRVVVGPDGYLYATAGAPAGGDVDVDGLPQDLGIDYGKVLRIAKDGSVPKDNPFVGRAGARPEIYALGFRDPQGAAINPRTGKMWTIEHGPRGGDELNMIEPGGNYGFPTISYGREYSEKLISNGATAKEGLRQPVYFWTPSIAPSGLMFYTGDMFPAWKGSAFVGSQGVKRLVRLQMDGDKVVAEEHLLNDLCQRIRDVRQGPDGAIYLLTESASAEILRLTPKR